MQSKFIGFWKNYSYIVFLIFVTLGTINPLFALGAIVCMLGPIMVALLGKGRFWCGNICPRGSFYDNVMNKLSKKNKTPKFLKSLLFRVLVILFMFTMFGTGLCRNWGNLTGIGRVFYSIIVITTLVGILLTFLYNERTWCNFCPMGSIAALIAKIQGKNTKMHVNTSCIGCNICSKTCPMDINPKDFKGNYIDHPDCITCGKCLISCPRTSIKLKNN